MPENPLQPPDDRWIAGIVGDIFAQLGDGLEVHMTEESHETVVSHGVDFNEDDDDDDDIEAAEDVAFHQELCHGFPTSVKIRHVSGIFIRPDKMCNIKRRIRKRLLAVAKQYAGYVIAGQATRIEDLSRRVALLEGLIRDTHANACGGEGRMVACVPEGQSSATDGIVNALRGRVGVMETAAEAARHNESLAERRAEAAEAELAKLRTIKRGLV